MVYIVHDPEQSARMIDAITILPAGVSYRLLLGTTSSNHYEQELSSSPNLVNKFV